MLDETPQAIHPDSEKVLGVIHSLSALPTPTDIGAEDHLEDEFRRRRQNTLPGLGLHQRYLRNSAQNPSEEEEEHGLQSLGLTRGHMDTKRKKLWLKEAESKKKRAARLFPRFGGLGAFF